MEYLKKALLIIDVQNDYFADGKSELVNPLRALSNIIEVLRIFREEKLPIIHIQHINTSEGATFFLPNTEGALIHKDLTPADGEYLVVKHAPNSFLDTNLLDILKENNITEVIICGMMSHMCIDTTVRACMDYGIKVVLLEDACATKNLMFRDSVIDAELVHNVFMASLNGMFARVIKTSEINLSD